MNSQCDGAGKDIKNKAIKTWERGVRNPCYTVIIMNNQFGKGLLKGSERNMCEKMKPENNLCVEIV